jgi:hypothetical protein
MKPNNIPFQPYMIECATSLGQEMEYPTDSLLLPLVQLQNIAIVNHNSLSTVNSTTQDHVNGLDIEMKVQSFQAEFERWKDPLSLFFHEPSKLNRLK